MMDEDDCYSDEHRMFLQGMMSRGAANTRQVNNLLTLVLRNCSIPVPERKEERQMVLLDMIHKINKQLQDIGLAIKKGVDEEDGTNYFMLISESERTEACKKAQINLSDQELEYLQIVADKILHINEETMCISQMEALNCVNEMKSVGKFAIRQAENSLGKLLDAKWLKVTDKGKKLALGVRFIVEMENWILAVKGENNVKKCKGCKKLVIRGVRCSNEDCEEVYHRHCAQKLGKKHGGDKFKCISCSADIIIPDTIKD